MFKYWKYGATIFVNVTKFICEIVINYVIIDFFYWIQKITFLKGSVSAVFYQDKCRTSEIMNKRSLDFLKRCGWG